MNKNNQETFDLKDYLVRIYNKTELTELEKKLVDSYREKTSSEKAGLESHPIPYRALLGKEITQDDIPHLWTNESLKQDIEEVYISLTHIMSVQSTFNQESILVVEKNFSNYYQHPPYFQYPLQKPNFILKGASVYSYPINFRYHGYLDIQKYTVEYLFQTILSSLQKNLNDMLGGVFFQAENGAITNLKNKLTETGTEKLSFNQLNLKVLETIAKQIKSFPNDPRNIILINPSLLHDLQKNYNILESLPIENKQNVISTQGYEVVSSYYVPKNIAFFGPFSEISIFFNGCLEMITRPKDVEITIQFSQKFNYFIPNPASFIVFEFEDF